MDRHHQSGVLFAYLFIIRKNKSEVLLLLPLQKRLDFKLQGWAQNQLRTYVQKTRQTIGISGFIKSKGPIITTKWPN